MYPPSLANSQHQTTRFSFWKPVEIKFNEDPNAPVNGQPEISNKFLWSIGSFADQFLSLGKTKLKVEATPIDAEKIYFETKKGKDFPMWVTALKVTYYVLSFGTLPLVALLVKMLYKYKLNSQIVWNPDIANGINYQDVHVLSEKMIGKTKIVLAYGSLTEEKTDVIVNAANRGLWAGGGVCGAIHKVAGDGPFDECQDILINQNRKNIDCGEAVITTSGKLSPNIKAIVHAAGPDYGVKDEEKSGPQYLASAYRTSLELTCYQTNNPLSVSSQLTPTPFRSIAFPSISTGIFKAPLNESALTALTTIRDFILQNPNALDEVRIDFLHVDKGVKTAPAYMKAIKEI